MEGHVNTPSEILQSPKDLYRKRPAPEGSRALSDTAPLGSPAVAAAASEKKITYSSLRHDKGDVDMHSPYNKMPSHFAACFNQPERGELPRKLAKAFGYAAPQQGSRKHQRDVLAEFANRTAQQAHDRSLQGTKATGANARHLDLESMD